MAMVYRRQHIGDGQDTEHKAYGNQLARPSQGVVNPSQDKLEKKAVVPKEFEHLRSIGHSCRPAGPLLRTDMAKQGFFILLRWLIGFFRPLHQRGFSSCQFKFPLYMEQSAWAQIGSVSDVNQRSYYIILLSRARRSCSLILLLVSA